MSESFEKAVEAASLAMLGRPTLSATTIRAAVTAALPHLTAEDVPHLIRQAKAEAWGEAMTMCYQYGDLALIDGNNPYAEEADHE